MYVKIIDGQPVQYTIGQLRKDNPNTSFPKTISANTLAQFGVYEVYEEPVPSYDQDTHKPGVSYITKSGGKWIWRTPVVKLTAEDIQSRVQAQVEVYTNAIQMMLDDEAKSRGYDGILSLCSYATSSNPKFQAEGQAGVEWRDGVWAGAYAALEEWKSGGQKPTLEDLLASLPKMAWPV